jgi:V8-like Glu-specific endopeptidase
VPFTLSGVVHASRSVRWIAGLALLGAGLAFPSIAGAGGIATETLRQSSAEVRDYWTAERMAGARPASELLAGIAAPNGLIDDQLGGGSSASPRAAQKVPNARKAPFRTHGKVFFHLPSGNYFCSATVVQARNKRLVITAGHCVFGDGAFADNWMFVPGKEGSSEPYGSWSAKRLAAPAAWQSAEDLRYDVGMATMRNRRGKRLQNVVGARGIAFDKGRNLHFDAFGYPAVSPFNGGQLWRCSSASQGADSGPPPAPTGINCDMTSGSSGGAWIIGRGRVNSVTSYGYDPICPIVCPDPDGEKLYGPYFGEVVHDLYRSQRRKLSAG